MHKHLLQCNNCMIVREVSRTMIYMVQKGKTQGRCKSCSLKGNQRRLGTKHSEEVRKKMSLSQQGKILTEQHRLNISNGRKGIRFSPEHITNLSISHIGKNTGESHPRWIKDRTQLAKYKNGNEYRNSSLYREWSISVKKRDKWKCQLFNEECNGRLESHHIMGWKEYQELRYDINNGITLCKKHHPKTRAQENDMAQIFIELISRKD